MGDERLVPGRECGDCTVCCAVPTIDDPEIQKKPGIHCRHCATGCTIYESRPKSCRDFFCAWRMMPRLGPEWRPDRSGIFSMLDMAKVDGEPVIALTAMLIRDADRIVFRAVCRARVLASPISSAYRGAHHPAPVFYASHHLDFERQ